MDKQLADKYIENLVLAWVPPKAEPEPKGLSEATLLRSAIPGSRREGKVSAAEKKKKPVTKTCYRFGCRKMPLITDIPAANKVYKLNLRIVCFGHGEENYSLLPVVHLSEFHPRMGHSHTCFIGPTTSSAFQ